MRWYCATAVIDDETNRVRVSNSKELLEDWLKEQTDAIRTHIGKWRPKKYKSKRISAAQRERNKHKPWMSNQ